MARTPSRSKGDSSKPTWTQVKSRLEGVERAGLLSLLQDLYRSSEANQRFLHARFELGAAPLHPYKKEIARWLFRPVGGAIFNLVQLPSPMRAKGRILFASYLFKISQTLTSNGSILVLMASQMIESSTLK